MLTLKKEKRRAEVRKRRKRVAEVLYSLLCYEVSQIKVTLLGCAQGDPSEWANVSGYALMRENLGRYCGGNLSRGMRTK